MWRATHRAAGVGGRPQPGRREARGYSVRRVGLSPAGGEAGGYSVPAVCAGFPREGGCQGVSPLGGAKGAQPPGEH